MEVISRKYHQIIYVRFATVRRTSNFDDCAHNNRDKPGPGHLFPYCSPNIDSGAYNSYGGFGTRKKRSSLSPISLPMKSQLRIMSALNADYDSFKISGMNFKNSSVDHSSPSKSLIIIPESNFIIRGNEY